MTDLRSELAWLVDDYISLSDVIESDRGLPPNTGTRERAKAILFMTDWQPIETAPKDGRKVLLALDGDIGIYHWEAGRQGTNWYGVMGEPIYLDADAPPTHWMLPPDPPA